MLISDVSLIVVDKVAFSIVINSNAAISDQIGKVVIERQKAAAINLKDSVDNVETDSQKLIQKIKLFFGV